MLDRRADGLSNGGRIESFIRKRIHLLITAFASLISALELDNIPFTPLLEIMKVFR